MEINYENLREFETKMAVLADILEQKKESLQAILIISENQENLYLSGVDVSQRRDFVLEMGKEKQKCIDQTITCDEMFQSIFDSISGIFNSHAQHHPKAVKRLQDGIDEVLKLDVKIRAQEEKTKVVAKEIWDKMSTTSVAKKTNTISKDYILNKYKDNNRTRPKN